VRRGAVSEGRLLDEPWPEEISLLVLATPVEQIGTLLRAYRAKIPTRTLATDVGSTKSRVVRVCHEVLGPGHRFVGSHPMAGSHRTGVAHADANLFEGRVCVVTPAAETDPEAAVLVTELWQSVGAKVVQLSPEQHDRLVARTSHLPHLTAAALCSLVGRSLNSGIQNLVGSGFRDTTRIAAGEPRLWTEICEHNRDEITAALGELIDELGHLRRLLKQGDLSTVARFLDQARIERAYLCGEETPENANPEWQGSESSPHN
jgi:prephenate dehydrogenase